MTTTVRKLKPFYSLVELSAMLGMSRWTTKRWLQSNRVPYELRRRPGATRGGRIVVLTSELRSCLPQYYASLREDYDIVKEPHA